CDARCAQPFGLQPRHRAWFPLDVRDLGRGMHGLPGWGAGSSACAQVQIRDDGRLSAWAEAREAARAHERLGEFRFCIESCSAASADIIAAAILETPITQKVTKTAQVYAAGSIRIAFKDLISMIGITQKRQDVSHASPEQ